MSLVPESERGAYTLDKIMRAVNSGADLALSAVAEAGFRHLTPDDAYNLSCLVANAIGTLLDDPEVESMADVLAENFSEPDAYREELGDELVDQAIARNAALDAEVTARVRKEGR